MKMQPAFATAAPRRSNRRSTHCLRAGSLSAAPCDLLRLPQGVSEEVCALTKLSRLDTVRGRALEIPSAPPKMTYPTSHSPTQVQHAFPIAPLGACFLLIESW